MPGTYADAIKSRLKANDYEAVLERLVEVNRPSQTTSDNTMQNTSIVTLPADADPGASPSIGSDHDPDATMIVGNISSYVDELNSDTTLRPLPNETSVSFLDNSLLVVHEDPHAAIRLCDLYLTGVLGKEVDIILAPKMKPKPRKRKLK